MKPSASGTPMMKLELITAKTDSPGMCCPKIKRANKP